MPEESPAPAIASGDLRPDQRRLRQRLATAGRDFVQGADFGQVLLAEHLAPEGPGLDVCGPRDEGARLAEMIFLQAELGAHDAAGCAVGKILVKGDESGRIELKDADGGGGWVRTTDSTIMSRVVHRSAVT